MKKIKKNYFLFFFVNKEYKKMDSLSYSKSKSKSKSPSIIVKKKRCPNGTRKNKKTGNCEPKNKTINNHQVNKRCPNGTRRNKKTGNCEENKRKQKTKEKEKEKSKTKTNTKEKENARRKIQHFMLRTTNKRKSHFLKSVCSDAGVCIAFGQETQKIKDYFGGFHDFQYVTGIKKIGKLSTNGYVLEIQYSKQDYNAHSILKNSLTSGSDNLAYEFFVGKYINKQIKRFPCFLETYDLFTRIPPEKQITDLQNQLIRITNKSKNDIFKISCNISGYLSLLIQHISNAQTLRDKLHYPDFIINDLLFALYQIYMPLMCLQNEFTHYDLHSDNVLLYEPVVGKYIQYHYFVDGNKITFKSKYIAKIIDYGRCFFYDTDSNNSKYIHQEICKEKDCKPDCGSDVGYAWLTSNGLNPGDYFINSSEVNISHDLRLLYDITIMQKYIPSGSLTQFPILKELLYKVEYGIGIRGDQNKPHGTIPNPDSGIPDKINNVQDAYIMLEELVKHSTIQKQNKDVYQHMTKLGDLYVYVDKPIRFVPV